MPRWRSCEWRPGGRPTFSTPLRRASLAAIHRAVGANVYQLSLPSESSPDTVAASLVALLPDVARPDRSATHEQEAPPLPDIVRRAADHVRAFTAAAAVLVADEHYVQQVKARTTSTSISPGGAIGVTVEQRVLDSEVALVQVLDRQLWMIARDVLKVDNHALPDSERVPLSTYHPASMADALTYFQQLATNSARFNIGRVTRNLNVPTLALWFLSEPVQGRFRTHRAAKKTSKAGAAGSSSIANGRDPISSTPRDVPFPFVAGSGSRTPRAQCSRPSCCSPMRIPGRRDAIREPER